MTTPAERLDPTSPHYDAELAALRAKAYKAWDDHEADMKNDPEYRRTYERMERSGKLSRGQ